MRIALALLPPVFIASSVYAIVWAVEPAQLRERPAHIMALLFGAAMALGELSAWLAR